jgi:uncharacterized membrane protein YfcA
MFYGIDLTAMLPFIAVGFAAQAVDGALGMAFGVINSTLLVSFLGVPPAHASAMVHAVETFTTAASGASPRETIGTVNTAEFFLTATISATFIATLGWAAFTFQTLGILIGGLIAAPMGGWLAKHVPARPLMAMVGALLTVTSAYTIYMAVT